MKKASLAWLVRWSKYATGTRQLNEAADVLAHVKKQQTRIRKLEKALRSVETGLGQYCPSCDTFDDGRSAHTKDCMLAKALRKK